MLTGDATSIFMLMKTISDYYEHPDSEPSLPFPTYEKYLSTPPAAPPSSSPTFEQAALRIPNLLRSYTMPEYAEALDLARRTTERVDIDVTGLEMRQLQKKASLEAGEKLSQGDALIALFWRAINEVYPDNEKCDKLMNIVQVSRTSHMQSIVLIGSQFRTRCSPDDLTIYERPTTSSVGNVRLPLVSSPIPRPQMMSLGALALSVRRLLTQSSDSAQITQCVALAESMSLEIASRGEVASFAPQKGCIGASLMHKGGFHDIHLGYPGHVRFWPLNEPVERYVRVVPANTSTDRDCGQGAVVVSLRVRKDVKAKFLEFVRSELVSLGFR